MKVIIDTNAFMIPVQFNVDIFEELYRLGYNEFIVPFPVIKELDKIITYNKGQDKIAAKVGKSLAKKCNIIDVDGYADDIIVEMAQEDFSSVLTNDIVLKKRLFDIGITVISIRQKNKLDIVSK